MILAARVMVSEPMALDVTQMQETHAKTPSLSCIRKPCKQIMEHLVLVLQLRLGRVVRRASGCTRLPCSVASIP